MENRYRGGGGLRRINSVPSIKSFGVSGGCYVKQKQKMVPSRVDTRLKTLVSVYSILSLEPIGHIFISWHPDTDCKNQLLR